MRRRGSAALLAAGSLALLVPVADASTSPATSSHPRCGEHGTVTVREIHDPAGGRREVWVYSPPGRTARTPVTYLLHGLPGTDRDFAQAGLVGELDGLLCSTRDGLVVAAPDGTTNDGRDTEWADAPDGSDDLESFVTGPLIGAVEGSARRPASLRTIGGFSMGGYAALTLALRHRDVYGAAFGIAGYYRIDDPDHQLGTTPAAVAQHDPRALSARARGLKVVLAEGAQEPLPLVAGEAARFAPLLRAHGATVTSRRVAGGHDLAALETALPLGLALAAG